MTINESTNREPSDPIGEIFTRLSGVDDKELLLTMFQVVLSGARENYIVEIYGGEGNVVVNRDVTTVTDLTGQNEIAQVFVGNTQEIYEKLSK